MSVDRRELHFDNLDQALADAEKLASGNFHATGSFTFGQILEHLARTLDVVTGEMPGPHVPLPMRWAARMMRPLILSRPMKPGFKLPTTSQSIFWPEDDVPVDQAMSHLREAIERYKAMDDFPTHPFFGNMNRQQNDQLQCRHCELHLSFVQPA